MEASGREANAVGGLAGKLELELNQSKIEEDKKAILQYMTSIPPYQA